MKCPDCGEQLQGTQCACGYGATKTPKRQWLVHKCQTETCHVLIRQLPGTEWVPICKWCEAKAAAQEASA